MDDCERFERKYMGKGWRRIGGVGEGKEGMCWKSYATCRR